jgi:hypothetical protein
MRMGAIVAWVGLALLAGGCNTLDRTYLREGVGTEVASVDAVAVTNLQEIYFGEICRQAGLSVRQTPEGALFCDEVAMSPAAWTIFVQAGMNDIDRRCDAYLAWLDDRRRWREPALKQLHSTAAATAAIMGLSGVGAVPIAIVGAAFGFAQETFVNFSGRLITEINHSTVQSLVLTRQNDYRGGLRNKAIPNRPAALYALRSYLRLCMPMTIETEINTTLTGVDRNGTVPPPMITPATIAAATIITDPNRPFTKPPTFGPPPSNDTRIGVIENSLQKKQIIRYQNLVCAAPDGLLGKPGSDTRTKIRAYLVKNNFKPSVEKDTITDEDRINLEEELSAGKKGNCAAR